MRYDITISVETNEVIAQDILDCIQEDTPEGMLDVIANITDTDIIIMSCSIKASED